MEYEIKTIRTHFNKNNIELGLEETLNRLFNNATILFVTSENYGDGEIAYTIIYKVLKGKEIVLID